MRNHKRSSTTITGMVLIFPILVLLIYGGLMYFYFGYAQQKDLRWELKQYKNHMMDTERSNLKEKVHNLVRYIDHYHSHSTQESVSSTHDVIRGEVLRYVIDNSRFDNGFFCISEHNGSALYVPDSNLSICETTSIKDGFGVDKYRMSYTADLPIYGWRITAIQDLKYIKARIRQKQEYLLLVRQKNIQASLWIMLIMLALSLLLSLYLSTIINRKLQDYKEQINESNEHLLFQSRQALIGELMPMIAHQWRQPINRVASIVALMKFWLEDGDVDKQKLVEECTKIEENIEFMSETIDDFRTFYVPKTVTEVVLLDKLILKALEFADGAIQKKDITIHKHLKPIKFRLHANEFLQVVINIITNAIDASPQHSRIDIALYERDETIRIAITDHGMGIEPDKIDKIFEPYYSTKSGSMGLGLYMSKLIVENHLSGEIEVDAGHDGGARFVVCLHHHSSQTY